MALIKCRECGNEISSQADRCPRCGRETYQAETVKKANKLKIILIMGLVAFLVGLILCVIHGEDALKGRGGDEVGIYFGIGLGLLIGSLFVDFFVWKKAKEVQEQEAIGKIIEMSALKNARSHAEQPGGWKCVCGRTNAGYVSTCSCGINRREMKK